jgi:alkanesulfonate monooxygenase SsuD/methylene tetrahydromethanopterin reductase-like flavin-dependent oxidoreductase (luciferase family)
MEPAFRTVLCRAFYPDCRCRKFDLGVGIGYRQVEFDQFKYKISHRPSFIDEGIEILRRSWSGEPVNFSGKKFELGDLRVMPTPQSNPKIYLGGMA